MCLFPFNLQVRAMCCRLEMHCFAKFGFVRTFSDGDEGCWSLYPVSWKSEVATVSDLHGASTDGCVGWHSITIPNHLRFLDWGLILVIVLKVSVHDWLVPLICIQVRTYVMTGTCGKAKITRKQRGRSKEKRTRRGLDLTVPFGACCQWSQDLPLTLPVKGSTAF